MKFIYVLYMFLWVGESGESLCFGSSKVSEMPEIVDASLKTMY